MFSQENMEVLPRNKKVLQQGSNLPSGRSSIKEKVFSRNKGLAKKHYEKLCLLKPHYLISKF
jgi:hypothetical protein